MSGRVQQVSSDQAAVEWRRNIIGLALTNVVIVVVAVEAAFRMGRSGLILGFATILFVVGIDLIVFLAYRALPAETRAELNRPTSSAVRRPNPGVSLAATTALSSVVIYLSAPGALASRLGDRGASIVGTLTLILGATLFVAALRWDGGALACGGRGTSPRTVTFAMRALHPLAALLAVATMISWMDRPLAAALGVLTLLVAWGLAAASRILV